MFAFLCLALAVQLAGWGLVSLGWKRARADAPDPDLPAPGGHAPDVPLSVVVAARDEAERLPRLFAALAAQTYPPAEVVIVDDASTDDTAAIVQAHASSATTGAPFPARLVSVTPHEREASALPPKKHAISRGVAAARSARVVLTDADTQPEPGWLAAFARHAAASPDAVLVGYGPLRTPDGFGGAFVRYETFVTATLMAAAVGLGKPYMAVGRSLSYPAALLGRVGGFAHQAGSLSGDDDLLVQEVARRGAAPVRFVGETGSWAWSDAPRTFGAWLRQKSRHASAGRHYARGPIALLALLHGSAALLWVGAPLWWLYAGDPRALGLLAVRVLWQRAVLQDPEEALGARDLTLAQPALDLLHTLYQTALAPWLGLLGGKRW